MQNKCKTPVKKHLLIHCNLVVAMSVRTAELPAVSNVYYPSAYIGLHESGGASEKGNIGNLFQNTIIKP
ncbi:hypothetical protein N482_17980 [Pseudoalteromonas luteoviolacea NCIMB 1942]|uniref:Uncharacterized protein n=1 Tax=Pseudoalteromonas luteoviolacea NCIMB 1942 TaxID=1365253 RepID=A0A166Z828_9GAMM|nr:hypothetical protein N482_17980 [Pseudoalteromonas luteoviolacea NCIMB 1942]